VLYTFGYIGSHFYKAGRHSQFFLLGNFGIFFVVTGQPFLGFHLEEAVVCDDFVVELSEDLLVVVD